MEIIANALQLVAANQNVYFTDTVTCGNCAITHRPGSGLVNIKGMTNQNRARFRVSFGGNIAVPTGVVPGAISVAIAIDGEQIPSTTMTVTPAAVNQFFNVFNSTFIDVPCGCCLSVSIKNISGVSIEVQNANLIVERVA